MKHTLLVLLCLLFLPAMSPAHPGHDNPWVLEGREMRENEAVSYCKELVGKLVAEEKLHKSWLNASLKKAEKKKYQDTEDIEWLVVFYNESEPVPDHKTLYFFLSLYGEIAGANFTGE